MALPDPHPSADPSVQRNFRNLDKRFPVGPNDLKFPFPRYNVKHYGAVGDGSKDDTTSIQDAIDAANTAGGGLVYLPAGDYAISSALTLYSEIVLAGEGERVTSIIPSSTSFSDNFIEYTSASVDITETHIRDLRINGLLGGADRGADGIYLERASRCVIDRVTVWDVGDDGIHLTTPGTARSSRIGNCHIRGVAGHGINASLPDPWIFGNVVADAGKDGILAAGISSKVLYNHIGRAGSGFSDIHLTSTGAMVVANLCEEGSSKGIFYDSTGTVMGIILGNRIRVKTTGNWGIHVKGGNRIQTISNVVSDAVDALWVESGALHAVLGNQFQGTPGTVTITPTDTEVWVNTGTSHSMKTVSLFAANTSTSPAVDIRNTGAAAMGASSAVLRLSNVNTGDGGTVLDVQTTGTGVKAAYFETEVEFDGTINHDGANLGFRGSTPIAKPTVSGSRGGNAALASLLTALADQGLITDSTTA